MNEQLYFKLHGSSSDDDAESLAQDAVDLWRFLDRPKEVGKQRQKDDRPYLTRHEFDRLHYFLGMINLGMILHVVERLFLFSADRHQHSWPKRLDKGAIDLGKGKRMLVKGGRLNPTYQITVPEDLIGVQ